MQFFDIEQNTDTWKALRLGHFTASAFGDLFMAKSTIGYKKAVYRVAFEKVTRESPESFTNEYMTRGHELEAEARASYEKITGNEVTNGGFFETDLWIGCSPDGLISDDGIVEIKCPAYSTIIDYIKYRELPGIYKWQVHGQMYVTNRKFVDFFAYHPLLKPIIVRVQRDDTLIKELEDKLKEAIQECEKIIEIISI